MRGKEREFCAFAAQSPMTRFGSAWSLKHLKKDPASTQALARITWWKLKVAFFGLFFRFFFDQKGISHFILDIFFRYDSFRRKHHTQGLPGYSGNYIGRSWIDRITFRNSLDSVNEVWWSGEIMDDLFSWRQRPWLPVNVLDPDRTACHYHQMQDLFEISLGSNRPRLTRGYISLIQWLTALHDEDIRTLEQYHEHLSRLLTIDEGFITDIEEEPRNLDK